MGSHLRPVSSLCALVTCAALLLAVPAGASPITIQPTDGKDTGIVNGFFADFNLGNNPWLVGNFQDNNRSIGLIEFDLSAYMGLSISSATLSLFQSQNPIQGITYSLFRVTTPWAENTVTFNTAPAFDAVAVASLTVGDLGENQYRNWDVTSVVRGWLGGTFTNYGLWLEEVPVQGSGNAFFASSDTVITGARPRLQLDPVPEPASLLLLGTGLAASVVARRWRWKRPNA